MRFIAIFSIVKINLILLYFNLIKKKQKQILIRFKCKFITTKANRNLYLSLGIVYNEIMKLTLLSVFLHLFR